MQKYNVKQLIAIFFFCGTLVGFVSGISLAPANNSSGDGSKAREADWVHLKEVDDEALKAASDTAGYCSRILKAFNNQDIGAINTEINSMQNHSEKVADIMESRLTVLEDLGY